MTSRLNCSNHFVLDKSRSFSEESSFTLSPASSTMTSSSSSSTCSSPPPTSPMSTMSDPPSPSSWTSECEDQSFSSSNKKRSSNHFEDEESEASRVPEYHPYVNKKPKFATKYDEMLQPMSPMTYLPVESVMIPMKTHRANFSTQSQKQFRNLLETKAKLNDIEHFLGQHSESIDINEYSVDGRTALHQCCFDGNLPTAKLLVRFGADAKLTTREGFSTLHIAAFSGHSNVLLYIMSLRR